MDRLTLFGLVAVTLMLVFYALEKRSTWFILAFAGSCLLASAYGFLQRGGLPPLVARAPSGRQQAIFRVAPAAPAAFPRSPTSPTFSASGSITCGHPRPEPPFPRATVELKTELPPGESSPRGVACRSPT